MSSTLELKTSIFQAMPSYELPHAMQYSTALHVFPKGYLCEIRPNGSQRMVNDWMCACICTWTVCVGEDVESTAGLRMMMWYVSTVIRQWGDTETCPVRRGSSVSPQMKFQPAQIVIRSEHTLLLSQVFKLLLLRKILHSQMRLLCFQLLNVGI